MKMLDKIVNFLMEDEHLIDAFALVVFIAAILVFANALTK